MKISALSGLFVAVFFPAIQSFAGWYDAGFQPRVEIGYRINLSSAMETVLNRYDPEFKVWEARNFHPMLRGLYEYKSFEPWRPFLAYQTLSGVIGDFNGDEVPDVVLKGRNKTYKKTIVLLSGNTGYTLTEISAIPLKDPARLNDTYSESDIVQCLELIPPGKIKAEPNYNQPEVDLKTDAFALSNFEGGKTIYYYTDGKFISR